MIARIRSNPSASFITGLLFGCLILRILEVMWK